MVTELKVSAITDWPWMSWLATDLKRAKNQKKFFRGLITPWLKENEKLYKNPKRHFFPGYSERKEEGEQKSGSVKRQERIRAWAQKSGNAKERERKRAGAQKSESAKERVRKRARAQKSGSAKERERKRVGAQKRGSAKEPERKRAGAQ